jgi:predicted DNA-binding transcriptional regulator AlpA
MSGADVRMHPHLLSLKPAKRHQFRGQWLSVAEIAELTGINPRVIYARIKRGQPVDEARKKRGRLYSYKGQMMTAKQVAKITGLSMSGVYLRACGNRILDDEELREQRQRYAEPHPGAVMLTYRGKTQNLTAWAHELGISVSTLHARLVSGWTVKRTLTTPLQVNTPRNRRVISRMSAAVRRDRNTQLIHRISTAFRTWSEAA